MALQDGTTETRAAPAALIGIGATGRRLTARVGERIARDAPANAGGLLLLTPGDGDALPTAVRDAARRLMRQRSVSALEEQFAVRRPERRYLTLHLVFAAALAEVDAAALRACLDAVFDLQHPPAGLEVLFLLDVTGPSEGAEIPPKAEAILRVLQDTAQAGRERQHRRWAASAHVRVVLAHPLRADGSRLDHPCCASALTDGLPEDEFEETLAAALAGHLAAGPFWDGLAAGDDARPFALCGWARETLPREPILGGAADLLLADALERTAAPEPNADADYANAAGRLEQDAPTAWQAWTQARADALLNRRALLKRLLTAGRPIGLLVEDAPPPAPPRPTFWQRLWRGLFGTTPPTPARGEPPLRARIELGSPGWQTGRPQTWPDALQALDAEGVKISDALRQELAAQGRAQEETDAVCRALARCVDVCVQNHLGGTQAARALLAEADRDAQAQIAAPAQPFTDPEPPDGLVPVGAGFAARRDIYRQRCAHQRVWGAILAAGLGGGLLGLAALAAIGFHVLLLGGPWLLLCLAGAGIYQSWTLARLARLGEHLRECLRAQGGHRLLQWEEEAAGDPKHDGVYQAVRHFLDDTERPALDRFDAERAATVACLRQLPLFPLPLGTDGFFAGASAVSDLHDIASAEGGEAALTDDARSLLRQRHVFADWRVPALEEGVMAARPFVRRERLADWERPRRTLGDFLRLLHSLHAPEAEQDARFAAWVRGRMDRLALRAIPLALQPPSHPERDDGAESAARVGILVSVTVAAPASLNWRAANETLSPDPSQMPTNSGVRDLVAWFGEAAPDNGVLADETDEAACLVVLSGLSAAEALSAFPSSDAEPVAAVVPVPTSNNGNGNGSSNGHGVSHPLPDVATP